MSYDLAIYTRDTISAEQLTALIREAVGLDIDESDTRSISVVRGAHHRYSFTVDGPDNLEPEDVPAEVTQVVLGPRYLWSVLVEGSAASEVPHAVRFARRLAQALDGAVCDQQTDELWTRSKSRRIQKPAREQRISEVHLDWFARRDAVPPDVVGLYLDTVTRYLPEALPRRFGEYEPFQGKYDQVGAEGFAQAWRDATSLLFFSGSGPVIGGTFNAGPAEAHPDKFWSMSLTLHISAFNDSAWSDALRNVFVMLADGLPAFYATAQVTRGHIWNGRASWIDNQTEWPMMPLRYRVGWTGLPPTPMWWTWLGAPYADQASRLPGDRTSKTTAGVLFENSAQPLPRDELDPLSTWLPSNLFARLAPNPRSTIPAPLEAADRIPDWLR